MCVAADSLVVFPFHPMVGFISSKLGTENGEEGEGHRHELDHHQVGREAKWMSPRMNTKMKTTRTWSLRTLIMIVKTDELSHFDDGDLMGGDGSQLQRRKNGLTQERDINGDEEFLLFGWGNRISEWISLAIRSILFWIFFLQPILWNINVKVVSVGESGDTWMISQGFDRMDSWMDGQLWSMAGKEGDHSGGSWNSHCDSWF